MYISDFNFRLSSQCSQKPCQSALPANKNNRTVKALLDKSRGSSNVHLRYERKKWKLTSHQIHGTGASTHIYQKASTIHVTHVENMSVPFKSFLRHSARSGLRLMEELRNHWEPLKTWPVAQWLPEAQLGASKVEPKWPGCVRVLNTQVFFEVVATQIFFNVTPTWGRFPF